MKKNYRYPTTTSMTVITTTCLSTSSSKTEGNVLSLKISHVAGD